MTLDQAFHKFLYGTDYGDRRAPLTIQETKVFNMHQTGYPIQTIANRLSVSTRQIVFHLQAIADKRWIPK
jgi:DNA-binding NarL/FixJ family response regulator